MTLGAMPSVGAPVFYYREQVVQYKGGNPSPSPTVRSTEVPSPWVVRFGSPSTHKLHQAAKPV